MGLMKAALYARVASADRGQRRTIASQVRELKGQIAASDGVLVKQYIDYGRSGATLDRPGLKQLRQDAKAGRFDTVYFLAADRIARDLAHQAIIVGELLECGKKIMVNGKDYVHDPHNRLALSVLAAFAELERHPKLEGTIGQNR